MNRRTRRGRGGSDDSPEKLRLLEIFLSHYGTCGLFKKYGISFFRERKFAFLTESDEKDHITPTNIFKTISSTLF